MNLIPSIAASLGIILGAAFLLMRRFTAGVISASTLASGGEAPSQHLRRMEGLLSPADFEFARAHGLSKQRLQKLRTQRRKLYRLYLRDLVGEFNAICGTLQLLIVTSATNRPDLAGELARQRFTFYRALAITEFRLALQACGYDQSLSLDMVEAVEALRASLQQFVLAPDAC